MITPDISYTPIPERATSNNIFDLEDSNDESGDGLERSVAAGERKTTAGKTVAERIHNALAKRQEKIEKEKVVGKPARTGKKASRAKARKGKARRDVMDVDKEDIGSNESGKEFNDWTAFENENDDDPEDGLGGDVDEGDEAEEEARMDQRLGAPARYLRAPNRHRPL